MKMVLAVVFGLLAITAHAAPYIMDGSALYDRLLRQDPTATAYIFGVYDTIQISQYHAPSGERVICTPSDVTDTELVDAVRRFLGAEPSTLGYPGAVAVLRAFLWAFPCDKA